MDEKKYEVAAKLLRRRVNFKASSFEKIKPVQDWEIMPERALKALKFGLEIQDPDFNIFVVGAPKSGRIRFVRSVIEKTAAAKGEPRDWCYVNNFENPDQPKLLSFPAGEGGEFAKSMKKFIDDFQEKIVEALKKADKTTREKLCKADFLKAKIAEKILDKLRQVLKQHGGEIPDFNQLLDNKTFKELATRANLSVDMQEQLAAELLKVKKEMAKIEYEASEEAFELQQAEFARTVDLGMAKIVEKNKDNELICRYLFQIREEILKHFEDFLPKQQQGLAAVLGGHDSNGGEKFLNYQVNLLVSHKEKTAPFVYETNPTLKNLVGIIPIIPANSHWYSHFTLIEPGALHKANGGYLILKALDVLRNPFAWETLKRAIKTRQVKIEDDAHEHYYGYTLAGALDPEPMPLNTRVILVGESWLYDLLCEHDSDFQKLFKVKVHIDSSSDFNETHKRYAGYLLTICQRENLKPLEAKAAARVIEHALELAESQKKLSLRLRQIEDLLKEADFLAQKAGKKTLDLVEIEEALKSQEERLNLYEEHWQEYILEDTLKIQTQGRAIGQINGLVVFSGEDYAFGAPTKITAVVGAGKSGIINIEERAKLAGKLMVKSCAIIEGFLRQRYGRARPLSMFASLAFEQNYGTIDGDSATLAETVALLSRIAEISIRQDLAITGSANQVEDAQAIGAVNTKTKGFYRICKERGLTGTQGVIIPKSNLSGLMLPKEIVSDCKKGKFHIYAVERVEEALEILMATPIEEIDKKVNAGLEDLAKAGKNGKEDKDKEKQCSISQKPIME